MSSSNLLKTLTGISLSALVLTNFLSLLKSSLKLITVLSPKGMSPLGVFIFAFSCSNVFA